MVHDITNFLELISQIRDKHKLITERTGENFNIFSALNIYSNELTHSSIIAYLLNAKGAHGQKDIFLKLFINEVKYHCRETNNFDRIITYSSYAVTEKHLRDGRIDIFISDGINNIILENKIWATDQNTQLIRYNRNFPNNPIIYLTLDGREPTNFSKGQLKNNNDFFCISYEINIIRWLEQCIKEMVNKPIIRETLNQYLSLIKQLTNQSTNNYMESEITDLILKSHENRASAKAIYEALNGIRNHLINKIDDLKTITVDDKLEIESEIKTITKDGSLTVLRFSDNRIPLVRFDLNFNEINKTVVIELKVIEFDIESTIWTKDELFKKLLSDIIFKPTKYDFNDSKEVILKNIKVQVKEIITLLTESH